MSQIMASSLLVCYFTHPISTEAAEVGQDGARSANVPDILTFRQLHNASTTFLVNLDIRHPTKRRRDHDKAQKAP